MISTLSILLLPVFASAAPPPASSTAAPVEAPLYPRCRDGALDVDALIDDRPALQAAASVPLNELPDYLACRGLAGAKPSCPALEGLGGGLADAAPSCRDLEWEAKFVNAILRRGDAAGLCRGRFAGRSASGTDVRKACSAIIEAARSGRPDAVCAAFLSSGLSSEKDSEGCRKKMSYWSGRADSCEALSDAAQRGRCGDLAALVAGLRSPKACAASPLCGALEKSDPEACSRFAKSLSRRVCGRAREAADVTRRDRLEEKKKLDAEQAEALRKKRAAEKQAKIRAAQKPQFGKGQAMQGAGDVKETMKRLANGENVPAPAGQGAKTGGSDEQKSQP